MSSTVRSLTYLVFIYTCIEGLVINIMYPNTLAFIFKDFIILVLYIVVLTEQRPSSGSLSQLSAPATVFAVVMFFFLLMPSPVGLFSEAVALKQRLFYIPLMYVGYHFMRDETDMQSLLKLMAYTAIPVSGFGIYLYFVGPSGLSVIGANYSAVQMSTAGEAGISFWRVPSTFTSPGQFSFFLLANGVMFVGLLLSSNVPSRLRMVTIVSMVVLMGALLVSGSRTPLLVLVMLGTIMLALMGKVSGLGKYAVGLYSVLTLAYSLFGDGVKDRVGSIASWEHVDRFEHTYFGQLFIPQILGSPMGDGLGIATIGARHFTSYNEVRLVESYFAIIATETGIFGFLVMFWLALSVVMAVGTAFPVMSRSPHRSLWYAMALLVMFITLFMPINTSLDAAPGNLYYWFFLGSAMRFYDLELARRRRFGAGTVTDASAAPALIGFGTA